MKNQEAAPCRPYRSCGRWKENWEESSRRYIDWWNQKGVLINMWEHLQQGVKPHANIAVPVPSPAWNRRSTLVKPGCGTLSQP